MQIISCNNSTIFFNYSLIYLCLYFFSFRFIFSYFKKTIAVHTVIKIVVYLDGFCEYNISKNKYIWEHFKYKKSTTHW